MQLESGLNDDDFGKIEGGASLNRGRCDLQVVDSGSGKSCTSMFFGNSNLLEHLRGRVDLQNLIRPRIVSRYMLVV